MTRQESRSGTALTGLAEHTRHALTPFPRGSGALLAVALLLPAMAASADVAIDADFPGGNIILERIEGDDVYVRPDLRDTQGQWFYWCFRVRGAEGRSLTFHFTRYDPVGVLGPAVSVDGGISWKWLGKAGGDIKTFRYTFAKDAADVRFGFGMTYTSEDLEALLKRLGEKGPLRIAELCKTDKGRSAPRLHIGKIDGEPKFRVLVTARHHACEMMASYAVEGIIEAVLADDETGRWLRENVELMIVPFVDYDGVEDGDQGKNRKPRDHNRDYNGDSIHAETAAIRKLVPEWSAGKLAVAMDLHCPAIRGPVNEVIYQVGVEKPEVAAEQNRFGGMLEKLRAGPLPYKQSDDMPFGKSWNTARNYTQGSSSMRWASELAGIRLATTFEIPYANAAGKQVTAESARAFGRDVAAALREYLSGQ